MIPPLAAATFVLSLGACIDKATVAAVARTRGLPLDRFNWCADTPTAG